MIYMNHPLPSREDLEKSYRKLAPGYESLLRELEKIIGAIAGSNGVSATVRHRVKDFSSWYLKLIRKSNMHDELTITDVMGVRIVCPFLEEVGILSTLLQEVFHVQEMENKGSEYPYHQFGYESVHFLVRIPPDLLKKVPSPEASDRPILCEVQVRTILQDAWAEVEHELIYKSDFSPLDEPLKRKMAALNANLSLSDIMFQELRDYQKEFQAAVRQRKERFYDTIRHERTGPRDVPEQTEAAGSLHGSSPEVPALTQKSFDTQLLQGLIAHNAGQLSEAIDIYSGMLSQNMKPEIRAVILLHRGMAYFSSGIGDSALRDFNEALELNPQYTKARYYRAIHSRLHGDFRSAFEDLEECINTEPLNLEYLTGRAETFAESGDPGSALAECREVMNIDPEFKPVQRLVMRLKSGSSAG